MKTATIDLVRLEGTYEEPIECNRILSCQPCDPRMIDQLNEGRLLNSVQPQKGFLVIDDTTLDEPYAKNMSLVYHL